MKKQFVIRGQTANAAQEILEFGGYKEGYAYKLVEFTVYPSESFGSISAECYGSITTAKVAGDPVNPNFSQEGLIGTAMHIQPSSPLYPASALSVVNDTFLITQNIILSVRETDNAKPINWQCRFESVKMTDAQAAATNFKQFSIFDE